MQSPHIETTLVGSLPRNDQLAALLIAKDRGKPYDSVGFERVVQSAGRAPSLPKSAYGIDATDLGRL